VAPHRADAWGKRAVGRKRAMQMTRIGPGSSGCCTRSGGAGTAETGNVYHTDFTLQALAKLERGFERDLGDVRAILRQRLSSIPAIVEAFEAIAPELYRFQALDPDELRSVVEPLAADGGVPSA
jgi:hypothetical protein